MSENKNDKKKQKSLNDTDKQILIEFYKVQWDIIHALDNLDWRIALIFIPLIGAASFIFGVVLELNPKELSIYIEAIKIISLVSYLICVYGLWTVVKGQAHVMQKFKTLDKIEEELGFDRYVLKRPDKYRLKRFWQVIVCRRLVLFFVYLFLGFLSYSMIIIPVNEWSFSSLPKLDVLWPAVVTPIFMVGVQLRDHKLHIKEWERKQKEEKA